MDHYYFLYNIRNKTMIRFKLNIMYNYPFTAIYINTKKKRIKPAAKEDYYMNDEKEEEKKIEEENEEKRERR